MQAADYEAEYDNRGRVPEHPAILARWAANAASFRDQAAAQGRAELGCAYGPSPRQYIDLFAPEHDRGGPLVVFIHGGYWRALDPRSFSHLAGAFNAHGLHVGCLGYDLCPQVRVTDIIRQVRTACAFLWQRLGRPLVVTGHSAGGHLAACTLATDWSSGGAQVPPHLVGAAVAVSGLFDLSPLRHIAINADLRLDEEEARRASPLHWPAPRGRPFDAVVGGEESAEFRRQSREIVDAWSGAGVPCRYEELAGANHFTALDPLTNPGSALTQRIVSLANGVHLPK